MRLLYICNDPGIPLDGTKGAAIHVRQTIDALSRHGVDVRVLSCRTGKWEAPGPLFAVPPRAASRKRRGVGREIGNLAVRGPTACKYLDDVERQQAYVINGWNLPGDIYRMDADGYCWYQARADDMIISAGYNISGPEVEAALLDHPMVRECAVVAAPDAQRGHVVKAFVVLRDANEAGAETAKELQDYVKAEIAPYKYPRRIEFVAELPKTVSGKIRRRVLRDREFAERRAREGDAA